MPEQPPTGQVVGSPKRPPSPGPGEKGSKGGAQGAGRWAPIGFSQRGAAGHRLANLVKLYYVPVAALRGLLESRAPGQEYGQMRQAELVRKVDEQPVISEGDVDALYESARYGQRLTFYLYLLPEDVDELDVEELQSVLDGILAQTRPCRLKDRCACHDYECETCPHQVRLLDEERWNGFREVRFRYYVAHRFLNADEQPDEVLQSRYGFLWFDPEQASLVILTRDEQVNGLLTRALATCLQANPQPVHLPKELLDKHFSIEKAKHLSYYDPGTGVRRCISGNGLWQRFEQEVTAREQQYARPSSLYDEEIAQGVVSGVGVVASQGKIYLTRALPTSVVRTWARQRLPELMHDLRELQASRPALQGRSLQAVQRMRLPSAARAATQAIVAAVAQADREDLTSAGLSGSALEFYDALAGRYFTPYLRVQCGDGDHSAELCPQCASPELAFQEQNVTCERCGATLSDGDSVTLACMHGHVKAVPKAEAWCVAPNHWFQKRIARILAEMGQTWDEKNDYFHIEGRTLYRLRKGRTDRTQLPPVVQNYISNFWDPVSGQVHAGSGDIVTGGGNGKSVPGGPALAASTPQPGAAGAGTGGSEAGLAEPPAPGVPGPATTEGKEGDGDMLRREDIRSTVTYTPTFHGPIYGPTHAGSGDIRVGSLRYGMQADELGKLFQSLSRLVEEQAPPDKKAAALQQVGELKAAVQAPKPDVNRMEAVLNWFKRNIPQLAGAVASVIVNPIVGQVVQAAGEVAADELRRRFGQ
jgi:hypothetical protein